MPVKIRIRESPNIDLPSFEPGINFSARRARYDKLEIGLDLGLTNTSDMELINRTFQRIADNGNLFRNDGGDEMPALVIQKRNADWIFGGQVKIYPNRNGRNGRIRAFLSVNVSRYFAHNPPSRPRERSASRLYNFYKLEGYGPARRTFASECLDNNDNLIVEERLEEALNTNWNDLLAKMIHEVAGLIEYEIKKYDRNNLFSFLSEYPKKWTIQSLEIYWEFRVKNAPLVAESFGSHAELYFRRHRKRMHLSEYDYDGASVSYIFDTTRKNVVVALYAKTENRLRVECRFTTYPKQIYTDLKDENYSKEEMSGLYDYLPALINKAQRAVAPLKEAQATYSARNVIKKRDLITTLAALSFMAGQNQITLERVIQGFLTSKRLSEKRLDSKYNQVLQHMAQRGLLKTYKKRSGQLREYGPTASLKKVLAALTQRGP